MVVADRWFPSSKTCSACGVVKAKLRLSDRVFRCDTPRAAWSSTVT
ncbi:zinc ribbon domain-containing protein [Saccharopolyspora hattusasensis]